MANEDGDSPQDDAAPRVVTLFLREAEDDLRLVWTGARYELQSSVDARDGQPFVPIADPERAFALLAELVDDECWEAAR
jgi:hypothetical protein